MSNLMNSNIACQRPMEVSVVIPCLDEERTLAECINAARFAFEKSGLYGEIIVADNGSVDRSREIAEQLGARVVCVAARGYGNALRGGIEAAHGTYVVFGDADGSYDFNEVPRFVEKLSDGNALVMGNRFTGKIHDGAMPWLHRYLGNPVLSTLGRLFFRTNVGDFQCGLRGLTKQSYDLLDLQTTGMEFASEMVIKSALLGLPIGEIPVELRPDGRDRPPHLKTWRDGWRHLRFMMLMCPRWLFWWPGMVLFLASMSSAIILTLGETYVGPVRFGIHTLLVSGTGMIIGVQLVTFAIYTERLAALLGLRGSCSMQTQSEPRFSLELGLVIGLAMVVIGVGLLAWKTTEWGLSGFGPLVPEVSMRTVIPAVVCMTHGFQILFGSFFLSFLTLAKSQLDRHFK